MAEETLNTPTEDSGDTEHPGVGTQESEVSEETTPTEEHGEAGEGEETSIDWEKRFKDAQSELTKVQQRVAEIEKTRTAGDQQKDWQKVEEERQKRLDVGAYMERYKENPAQGLNEWMNAQKQDFNQGVYNMVGPINSHVQLNAWRVMKMLKEIAPEVVEKHLQTEEAMKKVLNEVPALINFPDYLDQAEKMVRTKTGSKDLKKLEKELEQKIRKSIDQQSGKSIPATKAPSKQSRTKEERYKDYVIGKGRRSTIL